MPNLPIHPEAASNFAKQFNVLFNVLLGFTIIFAGGVFATVVVFAIRYREGSSAKRVRPERATPLLEGFLIGIPTLLGLGIFTWGASLYTEERSIPADAPEVLVVGKQWMWQIYHPNGVREINELTLPIGRPVRLTMISQDVIHAFYIPAFRVQYFVIPGRYTAEWFVPTKVGRYLLLCNQYCGMDHSRMVGHVDVLSQTDYSRWLQERGRQGAQNTLTALERGQALYTKSACGSCHGSKDGAFAPTLRGLFGKARRLADGSTITADADYIRNAITQPQRFRLANYPQTMASYSNLDPQDVWALVKYVESR
jgi:cytochrome c oxidase subunit 2